MKKRYIISIGILILLLSVFISCASCRALSLVLLKGVKSATKYENTETGREVIFIGMKHRDKPRRFEEVKVYLDMLREEGYRVFVEGIWMPDSLDVLIKDTVERKIRWLYGGAAVNEDSLKLSALPKKGRKKSLVTQSVENMGLSSEKGDQILDMSKVQIVDSVESRYGRIVLTDYDFATPLSDFYDVAETGRKWSHFYFADEVRNEYIARAVIGADSLQKIVLVYGSAHKSFIFPILRDEGGFQITDYKAPRKEIRRLIKKNRENTKNAE